MKVYLIHGWGFGPQILAGLADELAAHHETELLALPGYEGGPPEETVPDIQTYAKQVSGMIRHDSILAGWSLGGMAALATAGLCKNVRAVVLIASTPCFARKEDWPHGTDSALIKNMYERLMYTPDQVMQDFLVLTAMGDKAPRETLRTLREQHNAAKAGTKILMEGLALLLNTDLRKILVELSCPVIMLLGEEDRLIAKSTGLAAQTIHPALHLEYIPDTGHAPFVSRLRETAERINTSLAKVLS